MTKVDIISGFLGAGKTTLIKKLIKEVFKGQKVVLIENEFGEIGVDGGFLKEAGINITEMNSGCICCSLVGDFASALKKVVAEYAPDRVIIEPSGVGKLSDVEKAVMGAAEEAGLEIATSTAVVDAKKAKVYMKNFGEFFNDQIETARTIVLSRSQDLTDEKLNEVVALVKEKNPTAPIITTAWDSIDGNTIFGAMTDSKALEKELLLAQEHEHHHHHEDGECCCGHHHDDDDEHEHHHHHDHDEHEHHHDHDEHEHHHEYNEDGVCSCGHHHDHDEHGHHHHHHADEVFTSWGVESPKKFTEDELKGILAKLADFESEEYGQILRSKGIVPSTGSEWFHFDLTPEEYEVRVGGADYTGRICVIGAQLKEDKLKELFGI